MRRFYRTRARERASEAGCPTLAAQPLRGRSLISALRWGVRLIARPSRLVVHFEVPRAASGHDAYVAQRGAAALS